MSNTATCANCRSIIEKNGSGPNRTWVHRHSGQMGCGLIRDRRWAVAEPIPKTTVGLRHFGDPQYRPACGTEWSENLDIHHDWKETTCQRCMGTLKFKKAKGMTVKEPVANPQKCVHCAEPIEFHNWSGRWLHTRGPNEPDYEWCQNQDGDGLKATPPPLSAPKIEVTAPPPPEQEPMPQNEAVAALQERVRLVETLLGSARDEARALESKISESQDRLARVQSRSLREQQRLDQLNHALNLIGNA